MTSMRPRRFPTRDTVIVWAMVVWTVLVYALLFGTWYVLKYVV